MLQSTTHEVTGEETCLAVRRNVHAIDLPGMHHIVDSNRIAADKRKLPRNCLVCLEQRFDKRLVAIPDGLRINSDSFSIARAHAIDDRHDILTQQFVLGWQASFDRRIGCYQVQVLVLCCSSPSSEHFRMQAGLKAPVAGTPALD